MARKTYRGGNLQFTFKVDAKDKVNPNSMADMKSVFMDLDLNPDSKIYDENEYVFDTTKVKAALQFMINFIEYLEKTKIQKLQEGKYGKSKTKPTATQRIARIILNKNSPATSNLYYLSSYNGDLRPPKGA